MQDNWTLLEIKGVEYLSGKNHEIRKIIHVMRRNATPYWMIGTSGLGEKIGKNGIRDATLISIKRRLKSWNKEENSAKTRK